MDTITKLQKVGDLAIVGGMLRDITLAGNRAFSSDIDLVINPKDPEEFHDLARQLKGKRNRFGGYAFDTGIWSVEVWSLPETWAHIHQHSCIETFDDLRKATFFDCDAIIYNIENKELYVSDDYFQRLSDRVINVNLEQNPNIIGNIVRAFRYAYNKDMRWERDLSLFIAESFNRVSWTDLLGYERRSFRTNYISSISQADFFLNIENYLASNEARFFDPFAKFKQQKQYELF
ncbi:hypothetical protein [Pseudovibrio sp. FO-BEG1]|uniref:hypothetical protein n=1 Tax=Pseudovibrio sp. (strain FO-BEG1) TaxID=911045 RepID=UPI0011D26C2D|nr:hypothetical protein [Pseudovibrio sp. FO-BEG1]